MQVSFCSIHVKRFIILHAYINDNKSVSLLASIYIEDCLESASHNPYFFVRCKNKL